MLAIDPAVFTSQGSLIIIWFTKDSVLVFICISMLMGKDYTCPTGKVR